MRIHPAPTLTAFAFALALLAAPAGAQTLEEQAHAALVAFTQGVVDGPAAVAPLLAPEFQIMRNNGVGYDRDGYVGTGVATVAARPQFSHDDLVVTEAGGVMVTRYILTIEETIDGNAVKRSAPRLTVFRKVDGEWKVSAHANFGISEPAK